MLKIGGNTNFKIERHKIKSLTFTYYPFKDSIRTLLALLKKWVVWKY